MATKDTVIRFGVVDNLSPKLKTIEAGLNKTAKAVGTVAVAAIAAIGAGVAKTIEEFDRLGDMSDRLDVTAKSLSGLGFAAQQSGSSAEGLQSGLTKLNKIIGDAAGGNEKAAQTLRTLGVSSGKADEAFVQLADTFADLGPGAEAAALASKLFGKALGPELVPLLTQGSKGIAELQAKAESLGIVIGDDSVKAAQQFRDNLDLLKGAAQGFFNGLTESLLPALVAFTGDAGDAAVAAGGFDDAGRKLGGVIKTIAGVFISGAAQVQKLGAALAFVVDVAGTVIDNLKAFGEIAATQFKAIGAAAKGNLFDAADYFQEARGQAQELGRTLARDVSGKLTLLFGQFEDIDTRATAKIAALSGAVKKSAGAHEDAAEKAKRLAEAQRRAGEVLERSGDATKRHAELTFQNTRKIQEQLPFIEQLQRKWQDFQNTIARANADRVEQQSIDRLQSATAAVESQNERIAESYQRLKDDVLGALFDMVTRGEGRMKDFGAALEQIGEGALARLAETFRNTVLTPNGGGFAQFANTLNRQSMYGPGGQGSSVGGYASAIGSAYAGYQDARQGNTLGTVANYASAGAAIGGIYGAAIGAVVGILVAAFARAKPPDIRLGGVSADVRKPEERFTTAFGQFQLGTRAAPGGRQPIIDAVTQFDAQINNLLTDLNTNSEQIARIRTTLQNQAIDLKGGDATAENVLQARFEAILSTFDEATQAFVRRGANLQEQVSRLAQELAKPGQLKALLDALAEADTVAGLSESERQLRALNKQFDDVKTQAIALNASQEQLAQIETYRTTAINRLNEAMAAANLSSLNQLLDGLRFDDATEGMTATERRIAEINKQFDETRTQAIALGATEADLELIERRRTAALNGVTEATEDQIEAQQTYVDVLRDSQERMREFRAEQLQSLQDAARGVQDFLNRQAFGTSSLSAADRFQTAFQQFQDSLRQVATGDVGAVRGITNVADQLLREAAAQFGVGTNDFARIEAFVRSSLDPIAGITSAQTLPDALFELTDVLRILRDLIANGRVDGYNGGNAGVAAAVISSNEALQRTMSRVATAIESGSRR